MPVGEEVGAAVAAPPDPRQARTPADLVAALGDLRLWAGQPSLRTLRRLGGTAVTPSGDTVDALPISTMSHLLNGHGLPRPPRMDFVEAFVGACLRAAGRDDAAIAPEVDRWRTAWATAARPPSTVDTAPPPTADPDRRPLIAVVVALIATVAAVVLFSGNGRSPALRGIGAPEPAVHRTGTITGMRDVDGMDLDTGRITEQNAPGTDISPWGRSNHLVTRTSAMVLLLENPGTYTRCVTAPVGERVQQINGLHGRQPGSGLCVWTTDRRVALLTLTATPDAAAGTLTFDYTVWQP